MSTILEYIWVDGSVPTRKLRSKSKVVRNIVYCETQKVWRCEHIPFSGSHDLKYEDLLQYIPDWQFDGSSTNQAHGESSDCILKPVRIYTDPTRTHTSLLVLCEVLDSEGNPHDTNSRSTLRDTLKTKVSDDFLNITEIKNLEPWFGFEQEYTLYKGSQPLGFPTDRRFPAAQGPYYCGVGSDEVAGRNIVEKHLVSCLEIGLSIQGVNAEVMPGQWEFQVGGPYVDTLRVCDDLWIARWLLYRLSEDYGISATLDPKPIVGDWNGAGLHTNFSICDTRHPTDGMSSINEIIEAMSKRIPEHLRVYGDGYEHRLTGKHETCRYDEFKSGISDRTASIRIPANVAKEGCGYIEDRRPNANADPYEVANVILETSFMHRVQKEDL